MKSVLKNCPFLLFIVFCLLTLTACREDAEARKTESTSKSETPLKLPKLLDLGAHTCIPCKKMAPILDELREEYQGVFAVEFIDVWQSENHEKAKAYGVRSIPTQIFFAADGKELWRHVGFISKADIMEKWQELGFSFTAVSQKIAAPAAAKSE